MHHVSGVGRKAGQQGGALQRPFGMIARLDGVNPIVIGGGVVGGVAQHALKYRDAFLLPRLGLAGVVVAVFRQLVGQKDARLVSCGYFFTSFRSMAMAWDLSSFFAADSAWAASMYNLPEAFAWPLSRTASARARRP